MRQLISEANNSKLSDLHRAVLFFQRAREVRAGSREQRTSSRADQAVAWKKKADSPARW